MSNMLLGAVLLALSTPAVAPRTLLEIAGARPPAMDKTRAALVIIDAQKEYRSGVLPLPGFDPAVTRIVELRDWAHANGVPVIHVRHVAKANSAAFAEGSAGAEFIPELTPIQDEMVVTKRLPNSFAGTDLDDILHRERRGLLILAGFMTHMCVEATARSALDRSYESFVVADATATRSLPAGSGSIAAEEVKRNALAAIADRFAWIVPTSWVTGR
ncbi:cysteine hydrolase family protein [Methylobacterium bullatum]|uniref:Streptothricin hydrolase n=1 Tax=Methylobacterium bullatum TaxID=570505 RepID=A0A679KC58_9HYPH|nr:Streptothricin hydrolase [Methylobacterium bullatum]